MNGKKFSCGICKKVFQTKQKLDVHTRVHTGKKPFVCSTCGKGFSTNGNLQRHQSTHSQERRFQCDICPEGKFFKTKNDLSIHTKYHFAPSHECEQCGKKFHHSNKLRRHEKIHMR